MASLKLDSLKPGQSIRCTIAKLPRTDDQRDTLARLMRNDPDNRRALKKSQRLRRQNMLVYNRGNRDWTSRKTVGKIVIVKPGETWSMHYTPDLAPDFRNVEDYISIASA